MCLFFASHAKINKEAVLGKYPSIVPYNDNAHNCSSETAITCANEKNATTSVTRNGEVSKFSEGVFVFSKTFILFWYIFVILGIFSIL